MAVGKPIWTDSKGCSLPDQIQYGDTGHLITEVFFIKVHVFDKKNRQLSDKCMLRNFLVKKTRKKQSYKRSILNLTVTHNQSV